MVDEGVRVQKRLERTDQMDVVEQEKQMIKSGNRTEQNQILWIAGSIIVLLIVFAFFLMMAMKTGPALEIAGPSTSPGEHAVKERAAPRTALPTLGGADQRIGEENPIEAIAAPADLSATPPLSSDLNRKPVRAQPPLEAPQKSELQEIDHSPLQVEGVSLKNESPK